LKRADNKCEFCGVDNYKVFITENNERIYLDKVPRLNGFYYCPDNIGRTIGKCREYHLKQIILTVAHLDHDINNNSYDNLKALCQKCHLNYDKLHHATNSRKTRELRKQQITLFK